MFEPVRGGTRGGQAEFKWSDVSADKDREHYLGHSINAPTGRWQKNKDVHWYNRDKNDGEDERAEEIRKVKELEAQAIAAALGYEPTTGGSSTSSGPASGANATIVPPKTSDADERKREKEEKRRRKEEKRARKEQKRLARGHGDNDDRPRRRSSRSLSPRRSEKTEKRGRDRSRDRRQMSERRSRTPPAHSKSVDYDDVQREKERVNDRRRWEMNARRELPSDRRRY